MYICMYADVCILLLQEKRCKTESTVLKTEEK